MKRIGLSCIIAIVLFSAYAVKAQDKELSKLKDIPLSSEMFVGLDKFNNLYHISKTTLFKKTESGKTTAFQDVLLGEIDRVDILNPNKIIVFYKMANTVIILDNRMTEIDRHDFNRVSPFKNISFAGISKDQGLWIYNIDLNQLELYDYRYKKSLAISLPINDEILDMKNNFNYCFLLTQSGISIFNIYGSLVQNLYFGDIKAFDLFKNKLMIHTGDTLKIFNENFELEKSINFKVDDYKNFFYKNENLYLYDGKNISCYSLISKK